MFKRVFYVVILGYLFLFDQLFAAETAKIPVQVDTVTQEHIAAAAEFDATVFSRSHIDITAGVNGRLTLVAEPGARVNKGDILAKMDLIPLQLKEVEQKAVVKRAQIHKNYLNNELKRLQVLSETQAASIGALDQTQSQFEMAKADLEIAEIKLKQIHDQIERATVKAPFAGVVTKRYMRAGQDVSRSDSLLKLLDVKHLEARVFVPIKYYRFVTLGMALQLSDSTQNISAEVTAKIPSADAMSQTFEVRIQLPPGDNNWAAGQLVRVSVPVQDAQPALTVDRDALILRRDATYVVKIDESNKAKRLAVKVGKGNKLRVAITGELSQGDRVAIRGAERLQDGQEVLVQ